MRLRSLRELLERRLRLRSLAVSRTGSLTSMAGSTWLLAAAASGLLAVFALAASRLSHICSCDGGGPPKPVAFFSPFDTMATQAGGKENLGELFGFVVNEDKALWHAPRQIGLGPT